MAMKSCFLKVRRLSALTRLFLSSSCCFYNPTRVTPSIYSAASLSEQGEGKGEHSDTSSTKCGFWSKNKKTSVC